MLSSSPLYLSVKNVMDKCGFKISKKTSRSNGVSRDGPMGLLVKNMTDERGANDALIVRLVLTFFNPPSFNP